MPFAGRSGFGPSNTELYDAASNILSASTAVMNTARYVPTLTLLKLAGQLKFQECNDQICKLPQTVASKSR